MSNDNIIRDVEHKIMRERQLIAGFNATRQASDNPAVQSQADNQIREARRNIEYLESRLRELQMRRMGQSMGNLSVGQNGRPMPPAHGNQPPASQQQQQQRGGGHRGAQQSSSYGGAPAAYGHDNGDYGDPGPGGYSDLNTGQGMPPRGPYQPAAPGSPTARGRPNYSKLDLIKYDTPHLGPRIQLMLSQLEFKLSVEKQYKDGIEKIIGSYRMDGDKKIRQEAEGRRIESMQKIHLLRAALKRYEDLHVDMDSAADAADDDSLNAPSMRKPLTGQLSIRIHAVSDVNHATAGRWSRGPETFVIMKVEDEFKGRTKASKTDRWADELHEIAIDKGNEIELTVYDKSGGDHPQPIGMLWIRISDIAEEMRRKRIETEFNNSGWVSADRTVEDGAPPARPELQFQPPPGSTGQVPNNFAGGSFGNPAAQSQTGPVVIDSWFALEPVGRIHLSMSFAKQTREVKPFDAGLYRKGAIRQRKEEVYELHGHKFVAQQFYNIMRCALCGELLKYATGMQCSDCKYLCHEKCYLLVVTKCISKSNAESDPDEAKLNHRIPHRWETYGNMGANWCCHCGYILPLGRKTCKRCKECKLTCHAQCTHLVPDFCGMSMKDANRFLGEIKQAQAKAGSSKTPSLRPPGREPKPRPGPASSPSFQLEPTASQPQKDRFSYGNEDPSQSQTSIQSKSSGVSVESARLAYSNTPNSGQSSQPVQQLQQQQQQQQQQQTQQRRPTAGRSESSQSSIAAAAAANALAGKRGSPTETKSPAYGRTPSHQSSSDRSNQPYPAPQHTPYDPGAYAELDRRYGAPAAQQQAAQPQAPAQQYTGQKYDVTVTQPPDQQQPQQQQQLAIVTPAPVNQFVEQRNAPSPTMQRGTGRRVGLDHFNFLAVLGKGNFGKVMLAETKQAKQLFAIKVLKKEFIIENDEVESTKSERDVFIIANRAKHPFLLNLSACFQTETRVYFVMEYISGGDLMLHIQRGQFGTKRAQFYAAEVCLALKYFHENGVVYRDLKLDNILLTLDGHIKIADYGLCKKDMYYGSTTSTFCGTPEFMAPEILLDKRYGRAVDWWAFGVLIYQMLLQQSPFRGEDEDEIYDAILADEPLYPIHMPRDSVSILQKLLTREPEQRLGSGPTDAQEIMSHSFFRNINWEEVYNKKVPAPFLPQIRNPTDTSNFDSEFTSVTPVLTPVNSVLSSAQQEEFRGFSYSADFV